MHFFLALIQPHSVTMFVLMLICFFGYGYPGYKGRADTAGQAPSFFWLLWLIGGIMALVAWCVLVFS